MDVSALSTKQVKAAELLADALAEAVSAESRDLSTVRDLAHATAVTIDKLMTLHAMGAPPR